MKSQINERLPTRPLLKLYEEGTTTEYFIDGVLVIDQGGVRKTFSIFHSYSKIYHFFKFYGNSINYLKLFKIKLFKIFFLESFRNTFLNSGLG